MADDINKSQPHQLSAPPSPPPSAGADAVAELLAGLSDFDHMMACHVGIGYFDGTEITQEWERLVRPAMERLKTSALTPAPAPVEAERYGSEFPGEPQTIGDLFKGDIANPTPVEGSPTYVVNCCNCGRIVDTREKDEGGDGFGAELSDGRWTCSPECWDAVVDPGANPTSVEAGGEADGWIDETDVAVLARIKGQTGACRITAIKAHGGPGYVPFYLAKPASEPADGAVREALEWVGRQTRAAKQAMKESAALGNGYANFAAHDAHKHLKTIAAALSAPASSSPAKPAPAGEAVREALVAAEPFVELLHSVTNEKRARAIVWKVVKQIRAALSPAAQAGTVAQEGRDNG